MARVARSIPAGAVLTRRATCCVGCALRATPLLPPQAHRPAPSVRLVTIRMQHLLSAHGFAQRRFACAACAARTGSQDYEQKTALTKACAAKDAHAVLNLIAVGASLDLQVQLQLHTPSTPKTQANLPSLPQCERADGCRVPVSSVATPSSLVPLVHGDWPATHAPLPQSPLPHALPHAWHRVRGRLCGWERSAASRRLWGRLAADRCRRIARA